jgi:hypothetical protein
MKNTFYILGLSLILSGASVCSAAVTYYWDGSSTATPTSGSDSTITVGNFTRINGGSAPISDSSSPSMGYTDASGGNNFQALSGGGSLTIGSSPYFSVTLTPTADYEITINSISLGSRSSGSGPTSISFYSSIDGTTTAIGSASVVANSNWALESPTLSGALTDSDGSPLTLLIYGSGGTGSGSSYNWRIDDISLSVTSSLVPVPEPAAWGAISGLGLLGICGLRIWREHKQKTESES